MVSLRESEGRPAWCRVSGTTGLPVLPGQALSEQLVLGVLWRNQNPS